MQNTLSSYFTLKPTSLNKTKKYLLLAGMLLFAYQVNSQILISLLLGDKLNSENIEFGLDGGITHSNVGGFTNEGGLTKFHLGFYFDIRVKNSLFFHTGLQGICSFGMSKLSDQDIQILQSQKLDYPGDYSQVINAFYVPLFAQYRFKNNIFLEAGPQLGWLYNSYVHYKSDYDNRNVSIKDFNKNLLNWFDAGLTAGVGYQLMKGKGWSIGVRYYQGLTNAFNNVSNSKNSAFYLTCKVPIGAAAKEKDQSKAD